MTTVLITTLISVLATIIVLVVARILTAGEKKIEYQIKHCYGVDDPQFLQSMGNLLGPRFVGGNRITTLRNGDEIFPALLAAIRAARKTITLETFIYWQGEIGRTLADALSERARAGVQIHVLVDWLGSNRIDEGYIDDMKEAGVEVDRYHPLRWYTIDRINNRTHRKLAVIDGTIAFTGGVGIADKWTGQAQDESHWRDTHYKVEGPVVNQMQAAFMDNWVTTRSNVLHGEAYFPELKEAGNSLAQVFLSSPHGGSESIRLMFMLSISCARSTLRIGNAYFVPDDLLIQGLLDARKRGVAIKILVPGKYIDTDIVRRASRARWGDLLEAGCEIYEYSPTMYHCKLLVVDDCWVSVGSSNLDSRSLRLNDEANLNVWNKTFADEQKRIFDDDLSEAKRITFEEWQQRPVREKLIEHAAALFRGQL